MSTTNTFPEDTLTAEQLWDAVVTRREPVEAPQVGNRSTASIVVIDGVVWMHSVQTGTHRLQLACTDAARLHAHWQGFKHEATKATRQALGG